MIVRLELTSGEDDPMAAVASFAQNVASEWKGFAYDVLDTETGKTWIVRPGYEGEEPTVEEVDDPGGWTLA